MLLNEWHAWWAALPALETREYLAAHRVALLADAGWKLDRDRVLDEWATIAEGAAVMRARDPMKGLKRGDVRGQIVALFGWMRSKFTDEGRADGGDGFQEDR